MQCTIRKLTNVLFQRRLSVFLALFVVSVTWCDASRHFGYPNDGQYHPELYDAPTGVSGSYSSVFPSGQKLFVKYNTGFPGHIPHNPFHSHQYFTTTPNPFSHKSIFNSGFQHGFHNSPLSFFPRFPETDSVSNEAPTAEKLFTPASVPFPAESDKQIEAFNKDLQDIAQEAIRELTTPRSSSGFVDFSFGNSGYKYQL